MPTLNEHLAFASRLLGFLSTPRDAPIELLVGATYWASLHHVDAILAQGDIHPGSDGERNHFLEIAGRNVKGLYGAYRETKSYYEDTMYRAVLRTRKDYELEVVPCFTRIREHTARILGEDYRI